MYVFILKIKLYKATKTSYMLIMRWFNFDFTENQKKKSQSHFQEIVNDQKELNIQKKNF